MAIKLQGFMGEIPRTDPHYLPDTTARASMNASMQRGSLSPFRQPTVQDFLFPADRSSIYLHGVAWIGWDHLTDVAPGPVATDRLYITHDSGEPTMRVGSTEMPLRLPNPTLAPNVILSGTLDGNLAEDVCYAYTWVSSLGEESGPSPISAVIKWSPGTSVNLSGMPSAVPVPSRLITFKRIYRAITSSSGATDLFFVAEIAASATSYAHNPTTAPDQEAITTKAFDPPIDSLRGITPLPNGIMAGFAEKILYFSEPYQPHAWPMAYSQTMTDTIIGIAAFGTSLAVLTTGQPYIVQGMHPDSMAMQKMEQPFPCMAKRSIVDMGYSAIYASTDGLVNVTESGAQLLTAAIWTREQWRAMNPTSMIAGRFGSYYGFTYSPSGSETRHLVLIDPSAGQQASVLRSDEQPTAIYTHVESGSTFFLGADKRTVQTFDAASRPKKTYTWRSKPYRTDPPQAFGAIRIVTDKAAGETVQARVYADGALFHTITAANADKRLPAGEHSVWEVELTGNATVIATILGRTFQELNA